MSDSYLEQLKPGEALNLLARAAREGHPAPLAKLSIIFHHGALGSYVTLRIPAPNIPESSQLIDLYRAIRGEPAWQAEPGQETDFSQGLVRIFLLAARESAEHQAIRAQGEHLLIASQITLERARDIFVRLQTHATAVTICPTSDAFLYHVLDDQARDSFFQGLLAGDELFDCQLLSGFDLDGRRVFLPPDLKPGAGQLQAFAQLVQSLHTEFRLKDSNLTTELFFAILQLSRDNHQTIRFIDLTATAFLKDFHFTRDQARQINFQVLSLQRDEQTLKNFRAQLDRDQPFSGYRIGLRPTRSWATDDRERPRLLQQKADIEYRLAYLDSMSQPRPLLLRFSPHQLPALAAFLRATPLDTLHDGGVLYSFHAHDRQGAGDHYLYIKGGKTLLQELDPITLWEESSPMRFQLDPFWARHYHHRDSKALIFTPKGYALTPAMHHWDRHEMDTWMRRVVESWFANNPDSKKLPPHPLYVFEAGPNQRIQLNTLDFDRFQPIGLRLGWIHDNLILTKEVGAETLIAQMSDHVKRGQLAQQIADQADQANQLFDERAAETGARVAETTARLTSALTNELNRVVEETVETTTRIRKLDKELRDWERVEKEMRDVLSDINNRKESLEKSGAESRNRFQRMETRILRQLATSRKRRDDLAYEVDKEIEALKKSRDQIRSQFLKLKFWE